MAVGDEVVLALNAAANPKPPLRGIVLSEDGPPATEAVVEWRNHVPQSTYEIGILRKVFVADELTKQYVGAWVQVNAYQAVGFPKSGGLSGVVIDALETSAYDGLVPDEVYLIVSTQDGRGSVAVPISQCTVQPGRRNV